MSGYVWQSKNSVSAGWLGKGDGGIYGWAEKGGVGVATCNIHTSNVCMNTLEVDTRQISGRDRQALLPFPLLRCRQALHKQTLRLVVGSLGHYHVHKLAKLCFCHPPCFTVIKNCALHLCLEGEGEGMKIFLKAFF